MMNIISLKRKTLLWVTVSGIGLLTTLWSIQACTPKTKVIATWKDSTARPYKSFIVVAMAQDISVRSEVESRMVARLVDLEGIRAVPSSAIFTHFDKKDTLNAKSAHEKMIAEIQKSGYEAIITFALVRKEEKTRYVEGTSAYSPGYGYYGYYGPYYGYGYNYYNSPGYYTTDLTYYIESNVYDAGTQKLVWSTQSEIFDPSNLKTACNSFTWVMLNAMNKSKLIYKAPKK